MSMVPELELQKDRDDRDGREGLEGLEELEGLDGPGLQPKEASSVHSMARAKWLAGVPWGGQLDAWCIMMLNPPTAVKQQLRLHLPWLFWFSFPL